MSVILVIAAHPDDEILGPGATIARKKNEGNQIYALILGEGQTSRWSEHNEVDHRIVLELHKNSRNAANVVGYTNIYFENLPDNRFDSWDMLDTVKLVEKYINDIKPDIIYTHHANDLNIDHRIVHEAVLVATRPIGNCPVKEIYTFETVSSTEWNFGNKQGMFYPNVFVDVTDFFELKCEAMKKYKSELCDFPHPRSLLMLEVIAKKWGGVCGKQYVEAFELIRKIE